MPRHPYTCPRCGYQTTKKDRMHDHMYNLKKVCPAQLSVVVDLTPDVKEFVMNNRVYHVPVQNNPSTVANPVITNINNIVNQYNIVNNFLNNLDTVDKHNMYIQHTSSNVVDFERFVSNKYAGTVLRLENGDDRFYRPNDFLQLVNEVSTSTSMEEFNLVYDATSNKVKIYEFNGWQEFITSSGLLRIIETLKGNLLDTYEINLVQKIRRRDVDARDQAECREYLEELYRFLAVFRLEPSVTNMTNDDIMRGSGDARYNGDESMTIEEWCCHLYKTIRDRQPSAYVNRLIREIREIVKRNSAVAVRDVNRTVLELFNNDREFRNVVMNTVPRVMSV